MTEIASHRGGALLWAENSRLAFEETAKLPVEQVEFFHALGQELLAIAELAQDVPEMSVGMLRKRADIQQPVKRLKHFGKLNVMAFQALQRTGERSEPAGFDQ